MMHLHKLFIILHFFNNFNYLGFLSRLSLNASIKLSLTSLVTFSAVCCKYSTGAVRPSGPRFNVAGFFQISLGLRDLTEFTRNFFLHSFTLFWDVLFEWFKVFWTICREFWEFGREFWEVCQELRVGMQLAELKHGYCNKQDNHDYSHLDFNELHI